MAAMEVKTEYQRNQNADRLFSAMREMAKIKFLLIIFVCAWQKFKQ